jgi:Zn-dependent M28 family amino/carboxypeptidase
MTTHAHRALAALALAGGLAIAGVAPHAATPVGSFDLALPPGTERAEQSIDADTLRGPIRFLADDLLEGRGPASRGDRLARLHIASALELLGLAPAFAGQWEQPFEMVGVTSTAPASWRFTATEGTATELARHDEFVAVSGVHEPRAVLDDVPLLFVGYGIVAPEQQWDDFKGVDVRGKLLVVLNNDPADDPALFAGERRLYYGRWSYKYESAARQGAAGALIVHTRPSAGYPWQVVQSGWTGEQFELPAGDEPRLRVAGWVTEEAARRLAALGGHDLDALVARAQSRDFRPVPLGVRTSIEIGTELRRVSTANVGGVLAGSDPQLRDELVVFTAHHDHLGTGTPDAEGDAIYNGAVDNASGVAQLLAAARAFTLLPDPPWRSVLFLAVAAEESGLLGSQHFARNPTVHPGAIAANINVDSGNIFGATEDVALVGWGKSDLQAVAAAAAARQGRELTDEPFPDRGFYYRSDQFSLAKIGVPALYFKTGQRFVGRPPGWGAAQLTAWEDEHYHQPSDELEASWSFDGLVENARLAFVCALAIANRPQLPAWTPGDEFEAVRQRMLAERPARR